MPNPEPRETDATLAKKLVGLALVLAAAYALFALLIRGGFAALTQGRPENNVVVLFYGGYVVILALAAVGIAAAVLLLTRKGAQPPSTQALSAASAATAPAGPPSALRRGITLGLVVILAVVGLYASLFLWAFRSVK